MNFIEAVEWAKENQHLVGIRHKGAIIDEIIVYPKDEKAFSNFKKVYLRTLDPQKSIESFTEHDCSVAAVFNKSRSRSIFLYIDLENLKDDIDIREI